MSGLGPWDYWFRRPMGGTTSAEQQSSGKDYYSPLPIAFMVCTMSSISKVELLKYFCCERVYGTRAFVDKALVTYF